jgi:formylglycine-generating enzyme required for sulfatase activity
MGTATQGERQIFLSAVSREFRSCRELLRNDLSGPDLPCRVVEQEFFAVSGSSLLAKLDRYISCCTAVIHLCGKAAGALAKRGEVEEFLAATPSFLRLQPGLRARLGECQGLSYTQWEAYMALHHGLPLLIFHPAASFTGGQENLVVDAEEAACQQRHWALMKEFGQDRLEFASAERLSIEVFRSLSRLLFESGTHADAERARDLEVFAREREADDQAAKDEERSTLAPFRLELFMPSHLVAGQSCAVGFDVSEPGRTALEEIRIELQVGNSVVRAEVDHLAPGQNAQLGCDRDLLIMQAGDPRLQVSVSCLRACLKESFSWSAVVQVVTAEALAAKVETSRKRTQKRRARLELLKEELLPRRGVAGVDLQPVPAGGCRFEMGSYETERGRQPDEEVHPVRFSRSWWMSRHPISQAQFSQLMGFNPAKFENQSAAFPVENVTWAQAMEFCDKLTELEMEKDRLPLGFHYRLPTEAEWEFSCRGGEELTMLTTTTRTSRGDEAQPSAHPICTFPLDGNRGANRYGLCDMLGNVFQWCQDSYAPYPNSVQLDPCQKGDPSSRIIRGGSWHDPPAFKRAAARMKCPPETRSSRIGFRVVLARV